MNSERKHWSYSSIQQFLRCPRQWYFQRVAKLPQKSVGSGLVLGSAVHSALAAYHYGLSQSETLPASELNDVLDQSWDKKASEGEVELKAKESKDGLLQLGQQLLGLYLEQPPPENIVAIEQAMMAPIENGRGEILETPLLAFADLLTLDEDQIKIREFKTSSRAYSASEVETSLQPTCYVSAVEQTYDLPATVEYTVLVKTKKPKIKQLQTTRHEEDFGRLGDTVEAIERAIDAEAFYPVESPMNCSWCSYRTECRDWSTDNQTASFVQLNGDTEEAC